MPPDIAMCFGNSCDRRNDCFRYRAQPNPWRQSYCEFDPDDCDSFMPLRDGYVILQEDWTDEAKLIGDEMKTQDAHETSGTNRR